jgi:SAM-dependent methyltransferase
MLNGSENVESANVSAGKPAANSEEYNWVQQHCPICEIPPSRHLGMRGGGAHRAKLGVACQIWQCGNCSLIFPNPMPMPAGGIEQHYSVAPEDYFQHHEERDRIEYASLLMQQLQTLQIEKGQLLDIGSGRGEVLRVARENGWTPTGIETSPTFAAFAAQYSGANIIRTPLEECGFESDSFDAIVLGAVLEHLYNPDETVKEIARILKPGGALFVDVPNERGLYFILGNYYQKLRGRNWVVNLAPTFPPYHVFGFSPKSLRALLAKHHLQPAIWYVFSVRSLLASQPGVMGFVERQAARLVTLLTKNNKYGEYIATWAVKN